MDAKGRPVKRIEVDHKHVKLRVVLLVVCIAVAVFALGHGINLLINKQPGWQNVESNADELNCSADFTLQYYLSEGASAEYRQLVTVYSQACVDAYNNFNVDGELGKIKPNMPVTVSQPLYEALALIQSAGNRCIYLAPVYDEYQRIFLCENEAEAAIYDPGRNAELAGQIQQVARWCNDPAMINLELLENNQVYLRLSGAYLSYVQEYELETLLDFGWMKNAFIADYLAQQLIHNGMTNGYIASFDGYTRNLCRTEEQFSLNIFDRQASGINKPAVMTYSGPMSIVCLRNYPMTEQDRWQYFAFSDGRIVTACVDPADGVSKSAVNNLVVYSPEESCAGLVLEAATVYLSDQWQAEPLIALAEEKIYSIWPEETVLCYTDPALTMTVTESGYTKQLK